MLDQLYLGLTFFFLSQPLFLVGILITQATISSLKDSQACCSIPLHIFEIEILRGRDSDGKDYNSFDSKTKQEASIKRNFKL